jgi:phosphatidylserine decarboxylase
MNTDLCCVPVRPEAFSCFNDFFVREYARPFGADVAPPSTCVSPSEGKLLILRNLNPQKSFRVKRSTFHLEDLLASRQLSAQFVGGTAVLCRLGLSDYHHFHFPVAGIPHPARAIKGKLYAGGPYGMRWPTSFYADNYRMVTLIDSDLFGPVAQIEIGAFTVGSIRQQYTPGQHVRRGDKKGYFELGGSTIVLIFAAGTIVIDADLCQYGEQEIETRVRIGDTLGCTPSSRLAITGGLQGAAT